MKARLYLSVIHCLIACCLGSGCSVVGDVLGYPTPIRRQRYRYYDPNFARNNELLLQRSALRLNSYYISFDSQIVNSQQDSNFYRLRASSALCSGFVFTRNGGFTSHLAPLGSYDFWSPPIFAQGDPHGYFHLVGDIIYLERRVRNLSIFKGSTTYISKALVSPDGLYFISDNKFEARGSYYRYYIPHYILRPVKEKP